MSEQRGGVLITDGTGGLGGAVTRSFVEAGYRVATIYTTREKWENLGGLKDMVLGLEADLLDTRAVEEAARRVGEELGGLYALVNLVGGFVAKPLAQTTEETWDRMMDLNLKSAFL